MLLRCCRLVIISLFRSWLRKTYSNTTLETEISAVENEKIALQPRHLPGI